jgi:DNA-binding transcriptional regulator LsrR (DeoR family)
VNTGVGVTESNRQIERQNLLADIAEMYFLQGKNQAEIAKDIGMTRSNISRMLTEARHAGIIQIQINRPLQEDHALAQELVKRFDLINARAVCVEQSSQLLPKLGQVASQELLSRLKPGWILGTSWGTAISATVDQLEVTSPIADIKIVQLLGALGARIKEYVGHSIVRRLEEKLDAESIYINAPFLVENKRIAASLFENKNVEEPLRLWKHADIALLGVGSSELAHCSYFLADYVNREEILDIQKTGAVGDVCGRFFSIEGEIIPEIFQDRMIGISLDDLLKSPVRMGVAGGAAKLNPIIGALRSGLINILISDAATITEVLNRTKQ